MLHAIAACDFSTCNCLKTAMTTTFASTRSTISNKYSIWLQQALTSIPCSSTMMGHTFSRFVDSSTSCQRWPIEPESLHARYKLDNIYSRFMRASFQRSRRPSRICSKLTTSLAPHQQMATQRLRQLYCLLLSVRVPSSYFCVFAMAGR